MKTLKIGILLSLLSLAFVVFADNISTTPKIPNNNCVDYIEKVSGSTYYCGGHFSNDASYKTYNKPNPADNKITEKGYSCPKDWTWKFTASTNLAQCEDCRTFTIATANKDPNGVYAGCINGKWKLTGCRSGYFFKNGVCEEATGYFMLYPCYKRGNLVINGDLYIGAIHGVGTLNVDGKFYRKTSKNICANSKNIKGGILNNQTMPMDISSFGDTNYQGCLIDGDVIAYGMWGQEAGNSGARHSSLTVHGNVYQYEITGKGGPDGQCGW